MSIQNGLICSSHTISGVRPGSPVPARHAFEDRVSACADAGYTGMCLHFRDYRALKRAGYRDDELSAILARNGMRDISIEFLLDWFVDGDADATARSDEETVFDAATAYGATSFNIGSDFQRRGIARKVMKQKLAELGKRSADHGLKLALEIVPWSDVPDVDSALDMIDGIDNAGLVIDSWHIFRGGIALTELERIPGDRILCVQINDAASSIKGTLAEDTLHRLPCGRGVFDLDGFLATLNRCGATVPLSVEVISPQLADLDIKDAAKISLEGTSELLERHADRTGQHGDT